MYKTDSRGQRKWNKYSAWEAFTGFRNRCHDHFPKVRSAFYPTSMSAPAALSRSRDFFTSKFGKMLQLIFAFLMAVADTGGDTGNVPPTPPPPGS